jgi:hypothetical protein
MTGWGVSCMQWFGGGPIVISVCICGNFWGAATFFDQCNSN